MRAYVLSELHEPATLQQLPQPEPGPGEVLVRVRASSLNPHDENVRNCSAADYMQYEFPVTLGSDLAGEVVAVGPGVERIAVGQRVFGLERSRRAHTGTFAEYVAITQDAVAPLPEGLDLAAAGALGLAAVTALTCIDAVHPGASDTVLVNGATGGVGSYATQLAAAAGATVIATARPGAEEELVRANGASEVIDWSAGDLVAAVRALRPEGVDVVVDLVTADEERLPGLASGLLAPGGRIVTTMVPLAAEDIDVEGAEATYVITALTPQLLDRVAEHAAAGRLRAPISATFELADVARAFDALAGGSLGKIAVQIA